MKKEEFVKALEEKGTVLSESQIRQFEEYLKLLQEWNQKMNLTALDEEEQIWEKHFFDSLLPFLDLEFETMADVGSGAGFPGIPVQILWPDRKITLIEPLRKRCTFLEEVRNRLGLENLTVINERAEDFAREHRESFDLSSARAVARLSVLLELCAPLVRKEGLMVALKGAKAAEELETAEKALKELGLVKEREESYTIGEDENRTNFYFRKERRTPSKYPRAFAKIKKNPLENPWPKS